MPLFTEADRLRWVSDGQNVTCDVGGGRGLQCVVVHAHGLHAYVRSRAKEGSEWYGWEKLVPVDQLFPEVTPELRAKLKGESGG